MNTRVRFSISWVFLVSVLFCSSINSQPADPTIGLDIRLKRAADNITTPEESLAQSQLKIGNLYFDMGEYDKALVEYQKLTQTFPHSNLVTIALYCISESYYQQGNMEADEDAKQQAFQNAANVVSQVLLKTPDVDVLIKTLYTLGLAQIGLKNNVSAIEAFRKVTLCEGQTMNPDSSNRIYQAYLHLAELNISVGDYAAAVRDYQYVIEHTDDRIQKGHFHFAMGRVLDKHLKKYNDAALCYQDAVQLTEDPVLGAQLYYRIGVICQNKLNQLHKALEIYETLRANYGKETDPKIQSILFNT